MPVVAQPWPPLGPPSLPCCIRIAALASPFALTLFPLGFRNVTDPTLTLPAALL